MGDWNIDELPNLETDPFRDHPRRSSHHEFRRLFWDAWSAPSNFEIVLPNLVESTPHSKWCLEAMANPISHLPSDLQAGLPSALDYAYSSGGSILSSTLLWEPPFSDHAICRF